MRIAFITDVFPPDFGKGGIGTYTMIMASQLAASGWDVHVFAPAINKLDIEITNAYKIHRIICKPGETFKERLLFEFSIIHNRDPFQLVECPEINGNGLVIKTKYPNLPMVVRLHAPGYLVEKLKKRYVPFLSKLRFVLGSIRLRKFDLGYWRPYIKEDDIDFKMAKMANLITAPSNAMKQWAVKNWAFKEAQIIVIPNPVPTAELFLKIPIENSVQHKKILFFGRLNTLKGMVALTKAMAKILVEFKDWTFEVVGDDGPGVEAGSSMKNWMQKKLDKVKGQIVFSEGIPYDQLGIKLNEASFVVLPSLFESFSYTCAEAMAAGRAVIGSERGGMVDLLDNGKCGILINPESERDIYNAIKQLILNATLRVQLGSVARQWLKSEHDIHKTIHQFMDVYSKGLKLY